ncbi:MAG: aspartate 1-decarboxylase [Thermodesulfobacteriota bacterium]
MQRFMLKGKIHRAVVTDSNPDYEGSVAIDSALMEASGICPFEQVHIYNVTNGRRLITYAIEAPRGSGTISVNGAAARLATSGDLVIIACYAGLDEHEAMGHAPALVYVESDNSIKRISGAIANKV